MLNTADRSNGRLFRAPKTTAKELIPIYKTIKTKPTNIKPRTLNKTIRTSLGIRRAVDRAKARAQEQGQPTAQTDRDYAIDRSGEIASDSAHIAVDVAVSGAKLAVRQVAEMRRNGRSGADVGRAERTPQSASPTAPPKVEPWARPSPTSTNHTHQKELHTPINKAITLNKPSELRSKKNTAKSIRRSIKAARGISRAPKQAVKGTIKTVKTARTVGRASITTARTTVKGAKVAAHASIRAAKTAVLAAKVAAKAAVAAAKIATKVTAALVKALIAAIAAGGWVVVVIIVAVAAVAMLLGSAFGVFFSDDADPGAMKLAVSTVQNEYNAMLQAEIDRLSNGDYDAVRIEYAGHFDGDSNITNNWADVLAVYAVMTTMDDANGDEVLTITPEKQAILRDTFFDMNPANFHTETETDTRNVPDGEGGTTTETTVTLIITIEIDSMDYTEGADLYGFDTERRELLEEMMSPEFYGLFASLIDVDVFGGLTAADVANIETNLPVGTNGAAIAQAALDKVGIPYSVMDCSELSRHAYAQVGVSLPRTSVDQAKFCYDNGYTVSASQLQPGDLVFWSKLNCDCGRWNEVHHVGVYVGGGKVVDASSSKGHSVLRDIWETSNWKILFYARPQ